MLTVDILATSTVRFVATVLKAAASTVTEYFPGFKPTRVKVPAEEVVALAVTPVASLDTVICALGRTAPLESVTVPLMPFSTWARNRGGLNSAHSISRERKRAEGTLRRFSLQESVFRVTLSP